MREGGPQLLEAHARPSSLKLHISRLFSIRAAAKDHMDVSHARLAFSVGMLLL